MNVKFGILEKKLFNSHTEIEYLKKIIELQNERIRLMEEQVVLLRKELGKRMNDVSIIPALSRQWGSQRTFYSFGILVCLMTLFISPPSFSQAAGDPSTTKGLVRGIDYYRQGRYDEALTELRSVVESNPHCPLAYYYAAHIRLLKAQYPQARRNLLAALEDSADYHDATGLLSYTNLKMGNKSDALIEWRRFVEAVGSTSTGETVTEESIMLPEQYREKLLSAKTGVESTPSGVSAVKTDSTLAQTAVHSSPPSAAGAVGKPDSASPGTGAETALRDLDRRIQSEIRKGYYGIIAAAVLLTLGMGGIFFWIRRKRKPNPELVFSTEVSRLLDAREENGESDLDEERIIREYVRKSQEISGISPPPSPPARPSPESKVQLPESREKKQVYPEETPLFPEEEPFRSLRATQPVSDYREEESSFPPVPSAPSPENNRQPITEEIKALVTRLYREGSSVVEIARISDLTKTEVELILAVRARRMEKLIEAAAQDEDEVLDADHLYQAIGELRAEGNTVREIARRLGISTSEVNLALSMMKRTREDTEVRKSKIQSPRPKM